MKKLATLTFAVTVLILGAIGIQAQPNSRSSNGKSQPKPPPIYQNDKNDYKGSYNDRNEDFRGERTHYTTEYVQKFGKLYENTYEVTYLRNGRTTKTLVKSVLVRRNHSAKVSYETQTVKEGRNLYQVTYKITHFARGRTTKTLIKKVLINTKDNKKDRQDW